jgi:hypothetical protein
MVAQRSPAPPEVGVGSLDDLIDAFVAELAGFPDPGDFKPVPRALPRVTSGAGSGEHGFQLPTSAHNRVWESAADQLVPPDDPYWNDPNKWADENIEGWRPAPYQRESLAHLATDRRVSERGPHGLGKSGMAAIAVLWFADTRDQKGVDWKVVTTASVWRQLTHFLWPEIRKWAGKMKHRKFDKTELLQLELKLRTGRAFAIASFSGAKPARPTSTESSENSQQTTP